MSLPSKCFFYKDEKLVMDMFINIGWVFRDDQIIETIKRFLEDKHNRFEIHDKENFMLWDTVCLYGYKLSREGYEANDYSKLELVS